MGQGTVNGIEAQGFLPTDARRAGAERLRGELGLPEAAPVVGFVGRLVRDKGTADFVCGVPARARTDSGRAAVDRGRFRIGRRPAGRRRGGDPAVTITGMVPDPAAYYLLMDVFAFPSRREGFGLAALEAATAG
jgi:glycosyltransferase involved in cell wall biosynthesis